MKKETILQLLIAVCIFITGVFAGKNLQEILQKRAADALAIEMMEQQLFEQQEKEDIENQKDETVQKEPEVEEPTASENETASENGTSSQNEVNNNGYKPTWNDSYVDAAEFQTIDQRLSVRSSYDETMLLNAKDKEIIASSTIDFSNMKIACIGDSITEGFEGVVPYPEFLKDILGAKEVVNLGIGGATFAKGDGVSSIADRAANYNEDIDLLVVMGGTNDNFYQSEGMFGSPYNQVNSEDTFCGGLDWLMDRRQNDHPDIPVLYIMPPANAFIDKLRAEKPSLLDQGKYAEAFRKIGSDHGCKPVDLYNMNYMNSRDGAVQSNYMVDYVHFNTAGNEMLAERIASEIIVRYMK